MKFAKQEHRSRRGATALEYGVIAGLILLVILGGVTLTGAKLANLFGGFSNSVTASQSTAQPIPGVTGVDGLPTWVTTACQLPSTTQMAALAASGVPTTSVTAGCIPAGSVIKQYSSGSNYEIYAQAPGDSVPRLFAVVFPGSPGTEFSYSLWIEPGMSTGVCSNDQLEGPGPYSNAVINGYSEGTLLSSGYCQTSGITPTTTPGGGTPNVAAGTPSILVAALRASVFNGLSASATYP